MPKGLSNPLQKNLSNKTTFPESSKLSLWSVLQQEVKGHPGMFGGTLKRADTPVGESLAQWPQFLWCFVHEFAV